MKRITNSFKNLTNQRLSMSSYLRLFNILQDFDSNYFVNIFKSYNFNNTTKEQIDYFTLYNVDEIEFLDNISNKYYDTPYLWWVIALFNDIKNPFEEIRPGTQLKILSYNLIYILTKEIQRISEL